jgi:hypothetical protein
MTIEISYSSYQKTMRTLIMILTAALLTAPAFSLNEMTLVGQYDGETAGDRFGNATTFGDFDNDGYEEFFINAYFWNEGRGKNYYYDWDGDWPTVPTWTFQGVQAYYNYGIVDQNLADINHDGIDDFGVVELRAGVQGRLDILFGSEAFDSLADWSMLSISPVLNYCDRLDSTGDVNGDGYNDFICMDTYYDDHTAEFRIYFGGAILDSIPDWIYYPAGANDYSNCCGLGDVNGDDFGDVMLLSINNEPPLLFFGGSEMDTIPDLIFFEYSYSPNAAIGDINSDGFCDISMAMVLPDSQGQQYQPVYFGGTDIDTNPDSFLLDETGIYTAAPNYITHGDFNGDGIEDIVTGDGSLIWGDVVYVYLGSPWFNPVPDAMMIGPSFPLSEYGSELSTGDFDGDGCDEILVSAPYYRIGGQEKGRVFLYQGPDEWIDYGAGVEPGDLPHKPGWFKLDQNYPNPFNASTTIHFELGKASTITLTVYDLRGKKVKELISTKQMRPGGYNVSWSGRNSANQSVSSGVYLLEFCVDEFRDIRKMVLLR